MEKLRAAIEFVFSSYKRGAAILFIAALVLAIPITLSLLSQQQDIRQRAAGTDQICPQVITAAFNPRTFECRDFPTPCDVPEGWRKIPSCPGELSATESGIIRPQVTIPQVTIPRVTVAIPTRTIPPRPTITVPAIPVPSIPPVSCNNNQICVGTTCSALPPQAQCSNNRLCLLEQCVDLPF